MKIKDITDIFQNTEFVVFKSAIDDGGCVNAIVVKDSADKYSRKDIDNLTEFVKTYNEFEASFTKDDETEHACEQIYTSFEKYTIDKLKELQIYIISLLDQIGDNNVKIFTIGERIEEKYSIKYMLDIMAVRSLITAYLHQKYKENEEKGNGRVRTNDSDTNNELPYEI